MITCERCRPDLVPFLRDELDEARRSEISNHLASCEACRGEEQELGAIVGWLDAAALRDPPPELKFGVLARVQAEELAPFVNPAIGPPPPPRLKKKVLARVGSIGLRNRRLKPIAWGLAATAVMATAFAASSVADLRQTEDRLDEFRTRTEAAEDQIGPVGHPMQTLTLAGAASASLVHFRHDNFRIVLETEDFAVSPSGYHYEMWLQGPQGEVSVGSFRLLRPDEFVITFPVGVNPRDFPRMVVTLEPNDGDPMMSERVVAQARLEMSNIYHGSYDE